MNAHPWNVSPHWRLICFPYAGGSAAAYRHWQTKLGRDFDVKAIELAGRGTRWSEPPKTTLRDLLDDVMPRVAPLINERTIFFGHSFGALLCFELAHELRNQGKPIPAKMILSGRQAPQTEDSRPGISRMADPDLIQHLRELRGSPDEVLNNLELMEMLLPSIRADFSMVDDYRFLPRPKLDTDVDLFYGRSEYADTRHLHAWSTHFMSCVRLHEFDGDHFFVHSCENDVFAAIQHVAAYTEPALVEQCRL